MKTKKDIVINEIVFEGDSEKGLKNFERIFGKAKSSGGIPFLNFPILKKSFCFEAQPTTTIMCELNQDNS